MDGWFKKKERGLEYYAFGMFRNRENSLKHPLMIRDL